MAVIKATNSKTGGNLKKIINYVTKEEKTEDKYISGQNCTPETALEEMQATKERFEKDKGREYKHFVQSFKPGEVTAEKAHKIALEWSEKHFKGHEVLIATHEDKQHIHTHFIVNSVNFENGKKFQQSKDDLKEMKLSSDRICEREGLSVITEKSKEITSFDQDKYKVIEKAIQGNYKSYVVDTALAINKSIVNSRSRKDFIKNMENQGYSVKWSDSNKNVTFTNSEGEKVRLSNLQKTFKDEKYSKEGLENEFTKLRGKELERGTKPNDRTEGNRDTKGFGLSWNKSEVRTLTSGADDNKQQNIKSNGAEREGQRGIDTEAQGERSGEITTNREVKRSIQGHETGNKGIERNQLSEVRENSKGSINGTREEQGTAQGSDKQHTGLSTSSKEHACFNMEGESKTILPSITGNSRNDSFSDRGISTSPIDDIVKALEESIEKMNQEEKVRAEKEAEKLEKQTNSKTKDRYKEDEFER